MSIVHSASACRIITDLYCDCRLQAVYLSNTKAQSKTKELTLPHVTGQTEVHSYPAFGVKNLCCVLTSSHLMVTVTQGAQGIKVDGGPDSEKQREATREKDVTAMNGGVRVWGVWGVLRDPNSTRCCTGRNSSLSLRHSQEKKRLKTPCRLKNERRSIVTKEEKASKFMWYSGTGGGTSNYH